MALCAIHLAGRLPGEEVSVSFTSALTNTTEWSYAGRFEYSSEHTSFGFRSAETQVDSPLYPFVLTSLTANAWLASDKTRRTLLVAPRTADGRILLEALRDITPTNHSRLSWVSCAWDVTQAVHGIRFYLGKPANGTASGNIYLRKAVLRGPGSDPCDGFCLFLR